MRFGKIIGGWMGASLCVLPAYADQSSAPKTAQDQKAIVTFALENDLFAGRDKGYTNGVRFAYISGESDVPGWLAEAANLVPVFARQGHKRYGFSLGQSMFAPEDLTRKDLIVDDRPYAGFTYASAGLLSDTGQRLDHLQLTVGIIGPASLADRTQDFVHHTIASPDPQGWDNQLKNEPGLMVAYERKWRGLYEMEPFGLGVDVTPHVGASLGNVYTHLSSGATVRFGFDLPSDYGAPLIMPSLTGSDFFMPTKKLGGYLFAGAEGRLVGRNIFLDGNSFRDSHSVDKERFTGGVQVGLALTYGNARLAYTHVFRTREYDEQNSADEFGALTLSLRF